MSHLLFDTESDGLVDEATKVHCAATIDVDTEARKDWSPLFIGEFLSELDTADVLIGHNIVRHDLPLLKQLYHWEPKPHVRIIDTFICARLIYPNVKDTDGELVRSGKMPPGRDYQGRHTLGAWGYRLGEFKGDYAYAKEVEARDLGIDDPEEIRRFVWGQWSQDMHDYMLQDISTNFSLWKHLDIDSYSQQAIELEHRIAVICDEMQKAGVPFDVKAATELHAALIQRRDVIERQLTETFGSWEAPISPDPSRALFIPKRDDKKRGYVKGVPIVKMKTVTFNPGSRDHIAKVLLDRGWKPEKLTETGKPQIDEETVSAVCAKYPELAGLAEYLTIEKRLSQLADGNQAWLQVVGKDNRIHGIINPMGTTTSRAAHMRPNMGQVPAVKSPYGKECRSLFYAPKGWKMIGADMQGLELRGLAHYLAPLDRGQYAETVLKGDPHWVHAVAMGLAEGERDKHSRVHTIVREAGSKRFIYAYIYGCGDGKAGEIVHGCVDTIRRETGDATLYEKLFGVGPNTYSLKHVGGKVRRQFADRITGFAKLKDKLQQCVEQWGWLPGLDGRRIPVRSEHSALNFIIQSAGAILCKRWVCDTFDALRQRFKYDFDNPWNGDFVIGLWVHDEIQVWVREGLEEEASKIIVECASKAGEPYGFRVRLDGEAKVGANWAETH